MPKNIEYLVREGEKENIEFKEYLTRDIHLSESRFENLVCQLNHRLIMGKGEALYVIGVTDSGDLKGIPAKRLEESLYILDIMATELGAEIKDIENHRVDGGYISLVTIVKRGKPKEHILIGTAGHVDHGKSTLVGTIVTGTKDDGAGKTRLFLDVQKHEIERGLSADISYAVYGFKNGETIYLKNPLNKHEKARVVEEAEKLVSFVDTVGHEPWLRTTIRGLVGQKLDYGLLVIAADDGITRTTREHLGILLALELPTIIAVTKIDRVSEKTVSMIIKEIHQLLKSIGRIPFTLTEKSDISKVVHLFGEQGHIFVPIIETSAVTGTGLNILNELIKQLPKRSFRYKEDFLMYVDKVYVVSGVGTVVSGTIKQGIVKEGDEVFLGPDSTGEFIETKVQSIEIHHYRVEQGMAGDVVGIAVKGIKSEHIRRGMVLTKSKPAPVRTFTAEVLVFNHPTRIGVGYEPVIHLETISESVVFEEIEKKYLKAGDRGRVKIRFKYHPYHILKGQKFIFREGRSKGFGRVISCEAEL